MSVYTPLEPTADNVSSRPDDKLTPEQEKQLQGLLVQFTDEGYTIPGEKDTLSEKEKFWLSYDCFLRYLRAAKWVTSAAVQRLEETLKWRREYGVYDRVTAEFVEPEAVTGKMIMFGYDVQRRPCLHMIPSRQNTEESQRQVDFTVWILERSMDLMGPGVESICLMINYANKGKTPSMRISRQVLQIIQSHYPERLGVALMINIPTIVNFFFKLILPFVDPITRNKLKFNPSVFNDKLLTPDQAFKEHWGGDCDFVWDHEKYWPVLVEMCEKREREWMERWRGLGGKVGIKEWDYKVGDVVNIQGDAATSQAVVSEKTQIETVVEAVPSTEVA